MKLGDAARPAVPALARRVTDDRICTSVVYFGSDKDAAVDALRKFAPDRVEAAIIEASKSKSVNVQRWATEALGKLDDKKK
jgi:HEAT repeat protein